MYDVLSLTLYFAIPRPFFLVFPASVIVIYVLESVCPLYIAHETTICMTLCFGLYHVGPCPHHHQMYNFCCLLACLLTYLLTPWSRVLHEKLTGFAANQEIPRILWNSKVHYRTHKRPPPVPILSQLHHYLYTRCNMIQRQTVSVSYVIFMRFTNRYLTVG